MLRRAAKSLLPRASTLASQFEVAEAACCTTAARQFTSSSASCGIHIEEEVYNRCGAASSRYKYTFFLNKFL